MEGEKGKMGLCSNIRFTSILECAAKRLNYIDRLVDVRTNERMDGQMNKMMDNRRK